MPKKKNLKTENYLERIPVRHPDIGWTVDDKNLVTLEIENTGFFNKIAQKFFKKPKISYVHLDENGSFAWSKTDGEKTILSIGEDVKANFGEAAEPLYERLAQFFRILDSYNFIIWK